MDQQYDSYEYDEEFAEVEDLDDIDVDFEEEPIDPHAVNMPQTEALLRRVTDIIESAPGLPMSVSVRVNRDELLELLDSAIEGLPEELRAARWLLKEREEFLGKTRRDGEEIIADAKARVAHMVQRTEVVKAAEQRSRHLVEEAEGEARRIQRQTEDYCDQKLASFEIVLDRIARTVSAGRQKLSATSLAHDVLAPEEPESAAEMAFFDQDSEEFE